MSQKKMIQTVTEVINYLTWELGDIDSWDYEITSRYEMEVTLDVTRYFYPINELYGKKFSDKIYHVFYFRYNEEKKIVEIKMPLRPFDITKTHREIEYAVVDKEFTVNLWIAASPIFYPVTREELRPPKQQNEYTHPYINKD